MVDKRSLVESFELVLARDQEFPVLFYQLLFERHPVTRTLFVRNSLGAQRKMLAQTLMAAIDHFDDDAWLAQTLGPMGRAHLEYGVTEEMYDWVGECLLESMRRVCGREWTGDFEDAWRDAYATIAGHMLRGAHVT